MGRWGMSQPHSNPSQFHIYLPSRSSSTKHRCGLARIWMSFGCMAGVGLIPTCAQGNISGGLQLRFHLPGQHLPLWLQSPTSADDFPLKLPRNQGDVVGGGRRGETPGSNCLIWLRAAVKSRTGNLHTHTSSVLGNEVRMDGWMDARVDGRMGGLFGCIGKWG